MLMPASSFEDHLRLFRMATNSALVSFVLDLNFLEPLALPLEAPLALPLEAPFFPLEFLAFLPLDAPPLLGTTR